MNDNKIRGEVLDLAQGYAKDHREDFDPKDPGPFWGDALCEVLGGPDYLAFAQVKADGGAVISAMPVFGDRVQPQQFTAEQIGMVVAAAGEIQDAAPSSLEGLDPGTEAWALYFSVPTVTPAEAPDFGSLGDPPALAEALYVTALWLMNAPGGLLDLTRIKRPW